VDFIARRFGDRWDLQAIEVNLLPVDLIDIVAGVGLHFDPAQLSGSLFLMLGCLSEFHKLRMSCIGRSATEAQLLRAAGLLGH
jgi:hypothetical protein